MSAYPLSRSDVLDAMNTAMATGTDLDKDAARSLASFLVDDAPFDAIGTTVYLSLVALRDETISMTELIEFHTELDYMLGNVMQARSMGMASDFDVATIGLIHDYVLSQQTNSVRSFDDSDETDDASADEINAFLAELFGAIDEATDEYGNIVDNGISDDDDPDGYWLD